MKQEIIFGLALGGGGARGAVHIGVFMELERLGLQPDVGNIGLFDFHRLDDGIAVGREAAQAADKELQELAERVPEAGGN